MDIYTENWGESLAVLLPETNEDGEPTLLAIASVDFNNNGRIKTSIEITANCPAEQREYVRKICRKYLDDVQ